MMELLLPPWYVTKATNHFSKKFFNAWILLVTFLEPEGAIPPWYVTKATNHFSKKFFNAWLSSLMTEAAWLAMAARIHLNLHKYESPVAWLAMATTMATSHFKKKFFNAWFSLSYVDEVEFFLQMLDSQ